MLIINNVYIAALIVDV